MSRLKDTFRGKVVNKRLTVNTGILLSVGVRGNFPAFSSGPGNWLLQPVGPRV